MIGRDVGNYRVTALIGEGGMGLVYLAEHATIERKVAVKVLRNDLPASGDLVNRFVNEARIAATIRHANVIEVFDTGMLQPEGVPYIVMELLEGESLAARLARVGRLEIAEATLWTYEAAAALAVAHAKGIIHRDLKPANLYLVADDRQPEREKIKVLDFGIAKLRGGLAEFGSKTQTGSIMGTPVYMSPEQCRGIKEIDTRSDIYALGIILYEMLCGAPPFVSTGFGDLISMHLLTAPAPPRLHNPAISEALERVILTALAKKPEDRFATVAEFQAALGYEPSRVAPTSSAMRAVTPASGVGASSRPPSASPSAAAIAAGAIQTMASPVTHPPAPAPSQPPSMTPATAPATTPPAPRSTRPSGGTQISRGSIMVTPSAGVPIAGDPRTGGAGGSGGGGRAKRKGFPLPLAIAGGLVAVVGIVLAFIGGQIGPRVRCLTGKSCTELGDCYDAGRCGIARDRERACELYDKDCSAGQMASCVRFGHCYEAHTGGIQSNWARACDLYEKACEADNLAGCAHLADCLREGVGGREKQAKKSCDFAQRACDGGEMYGCVGLGLCQQSGLGDVAKNEKEACQQFQRSCDAGQQVGCTWLGVCHTGNSPEGFPRSDQAACQIYRKSCDDGGALSCSYVATCYRDGSGGLPQNEARACDLFGKACDDSGFAERSGCDAFAACLRQGSGGQSKNPAQADRVEERVCNDGDARACVTLAASFDEGAKGRPKDAVRACEFHAKACTGGGFDCLKAGRCHCRGAVAGMPNPTAAHEAFAKACKSGDKQACDEDKTPGCVPGGGAALANGAPGVATAGARAAAARAAAAQAAGAPAGGAQAARTMPPRGAPMPPAGARPGVGAVSPATLAAYKAGRLPLPPGAATPRAMPGAPRGAPVPTPASRPTTTKPQKAAKGGRDYLKEEID